MTETDAQIIAAFAAVCAAVATGFAAWTAYFGPIRAARLAEDLRTVTEVRTNRERAKLNILGSLMTHRRSFWLPEPVSAFNLIDLVYNDNQEVRAAWAEMYLSVTTKSIPQHVQEEKLRRLLSAMSKDLKLADDLRTDDFGRIYHPDAMFEEQLVQAYQRKAALEAFTRKDTPPGTDSSSSEEVSDVFPPKPKRRDA